jgi:hypothetical protein
MNGSGRCGCEVTEEEFKEGYNKYVLEEVSRDLENL